MDTLDPVAMSVLTRGVDFLFDQAGKLMEERREARKARGEQEDTPDPKNNRTYTTKEEVMAWQPKKIYLKDLPQEISHCLEMIQQYRDNRRRLNATIAAYNGFVFAPGHIQYQLRDTEDQIKNWCQKLKDLIEESYGHKIIIIGLK